MEPAAVPVPVRATFCGEPDALSEISSVAESAPMARGLKVIAMVQAAFAARELPHVVVLRKDLGSDPAIVMPVPVISSVAAPVLVSLTIWAALLDPIFVPAKVSFDTENDAAGAIAFDQLLTRL